MKNLKELVSIKSKRFWEAPFGPIWALPRPPPLCQTGKRGKKCSKPSWQAFTPPPPLFGLSGNARMETTHFKKGLPYLWHSSDSSQGAQPVGQMLALHSPVEGLVAFTVQEPGWRKQSKLRNIYQVHVSGTSIMDRNDERNKNQPSWRLVGWPCLSQVFTYWSKLASSVANSWKS